MVLVEDDGVRVRLRPRDAVTARLDIAYVNTVLARVGLPYRIAPGGKPRDFWNFTVADGDHAWPFDCEALHGVRLDRDPNGNRARLAAEALGSFTS